MKDLLLCVLSSGLLILSFPNFNLWVFAWIGFVPLFFALKNKSRRKAFLLAYLTGVIFWIGIIYWLVHVTLPGMILLALYLALYFGIFGLLLSTMDYGLWTMDLFAIPALWVVLEYLRSQLFTGFPWALLGYSQYLNLPAIQIADITGAWGVSFLVMMVNAAIYSILDGRSSILAKKKQCLFPILVLLIALAYGYYQIYPASSIPACPAGRQHPASIRVSVIQPNIPQELKWDEQAKEPILNRYWQLTAQAAQDKPDLIIWPEAALPVVLEEDPSYFRRVEDFTRALKIPLLLGAVTRRNNLYYNSALLISSQGSLETQYDKIHLVPFGEYIPLRNVLSFMETIVPIGDFAPGKEYRLFQISCLPDRQANFKFPISNNFAVLICFEDVFPELSRQFVKGGADFLVNITNDAWFKKTSSAYQHLQASVFRAVENRVFLVRAANTGVSGFIAPSGKIISLLQGQKGENIFTSGILSKKIFLPRQGISFYTRYGEVFILCAFIFLIYLTISALKIKKWPRD